MTADETPVEVIATYAVHAGITARIWYDTGGAPVDPDLIALYLIEDTEDTEVVSLCHQCDNIVDPQVGELARFTVNGISYAVDPETGTWQPEVDRG